MRISNRDWIAWSVAAAILVIAGYYYFETQSVPPSAGVYRIVVTPDRT